jgi:predicted transcriptional regulator
MNYQLLQYKAVLPADSLLEILLRIIMDNKSIHLSDTDYKLAIYVMKNGASLEELKVAVNQGIFQSVATVRNALTRLHKSNILIRDKSRKLTNGRFIFNHDLIPKITTPGILLTLKLKADDYQIQGEV